MHAITTSILIERWNMIYFPLSQSQNQAASIALKRTCCQPRSQNMRGLDWFQTLQYIMFFDVFKESALWANAFYKSKCPCVSPCVRLFTFEVPFKRLFAPTSQSRMSKISDSESLGKNNGKKWSQIWTFFCWFYRTKHVENHASRWMRDLWSKGISQMLAYL